RARAPASTSTGTPSSRAGLGLCICLSSAFPRSCAGFTPSPIARSPGGAGAATSTAGPKNRPTASAAWIVIRLRQTGLRADVQGRLPMSSLRALLPTFALVLCTLPAGAADQPASRTFDAKGVKLHDLVKGKGKPVVLIHGLHSSAAINWQMTGVIDALAGD